MPDTDTPITIHQLIIHKVDHKNFDEPQLADLESPTTDKEVLSFLRKQIASNREHKYTRSAAFVDPAPDPVSLQSVCDAMLDKPRDFVAQSQAIATHLFSKSKQNTSIGDLVACTFSEDPDQKARWLALLKMDPEDGFVGRRTGPKGKVQIVLE